MKERPIPFTGPMVRSILEGRKMQTRRIMKPQPGYFGKEDGQDSWHWNGWRWQDKPGLPLKGPEEDCPYGQPGDRLWVKESFCQKIDYDGHVYNADGNLDSSCCYYEADGIEVEAVDVFGTPLYTKRGFPKSPWVSSRFMPRWASRITLLIVSVVVERLNDISETDAQAEGVGMLAKGCKFCHSLHDDPSAKVKHHTHIHSSYREKFRCLWESINGKGSWDLNPWVWVIEFGRLEDSRE